MDALAAPRTVRPAAVILSAAMLISIGLVMVASATTSLDRPVLSVGAFSGAFGRQAVFAAIGIIIILVTAKIAVPILDSERLTKRVPQIFFVIAVLLLAAALVPGLSDPHRGSNRWLRVDSVGFGLGVQPSEVAKIALVAILASILGCPGADPRSFGRSFVPATIAIGVCVALVGKENFGTAALLGLASGAVMFVAGCRWLHLLLIAAGGASGLAVLLLAAPYRLQRLAAHQNMWEDPLGAGYQPVQSLVTIASGGWFGTGLGSGVQKYGYLPESHTDFVYAVICEELGVFGGVLVLVLFCAFVWLGLRTFLCAATRFERLLGFGLTFMVATQAAMNVAVVTVLTPTTGVPLPFLSAGGSGMFTTCAMVGLLAAIAARAQRLQSRGVAETSS